MSAKFAIFVFAHDLALFGSLVASELSANWL